jgi:hypothetical protein
LPLWRAEGRECRKCEVIGVTALALSSAAARSAMTAGSASNGDSGAGLGEGDGEGDGEALAGAEPALVAVGGSGCAEGESSPHAAVSSTARAPRVTRLALLMSRGPVMSSAPHVVGLLCRLMPAVTLLSVTGTRSHYRCSFAAYG